MKTTPSGVRHICHAALIAALYTALTFISFQLGLTSMAVQIRFSEALCVLPLFMPAAVPGLTIGCVISNIMLGSALWDIILGSLATLLGAVGTLFLGKWSKRRRLAIRLSPLPNIIANTLILPPVIALVYGTDMAVPVLFLAVFGGEVLSTAALGIPLALMLERSALVRKMGL